MKYLFLLLLLSCEKQVIVCNYTELTETLVQACIRRGSTEKVCIERMIPLFCDTLR